MKIANIILVALALFTGLTPAHSQSFIEGTHYGVLDIPQTDSGKKEVVEYFSFSCPGCYAIEPIIESRISANSEIEFRRVHAPFGGRLAKQSQKAFVLSELLGAGQHNAAIFDRLHKQKDFFNNDGELTNFFIGLGYKESLVRSHLNSFLADVMVRKMNKQVKINKITSVPSIVVNGRYRVNLNAINDGDELAALIDHLYSLAVPGVGPSAKIMSKVN